MIASVVIPTRDRRETLLPLLEHLLPQAAVCGAEVVEERRLPVRIRGRREEGTDGDTGGPGLRIGGVLLA